MIMSITKQRELQAEYEREVAAQVALERKLMAVASVLGIIAVLLIITFGLHD